MTSEETFVTIEKIAREMAQREHGNEGLWELRCADATAIYIYQPEKAKALARAYDQRKRKGASR